MIHIKGREGQDNFVQLRYLTQNPDVIDDLSRDEVEELFDNDIEVDQEQILKTADEYGINLNDLSK